MDVTELKCVGPDPGITLAISLDLPQMVLRSTKRHVYCELSTNSGIQSTMKRLGGLCRACTVL